MAKMPRVWDGSQWQELAVTLPDLSNYSTTTQMNTAIDNAKGLVLVNKTDINAASTINLNNIFSSTYDNYKLILDCSSSTSSALQMRLRVGGVDASGNDYTNQYVRASGSSVAGSSFTQTVWDANTTTTAAGNYYFQYELFNPAKAVKTGLIYNQFSVSGSTYWIALEGGVHGLSTSYDGLSILVSSGTITGTIRIYGYRNS